MAKTVKTDGTVRFYGFDQETATYIIDQMVENGRDLIHILREPHMPSVKTIYMWMARNPQFEAEYRAARMSLADHAVAQIQHIIDTVTDENASAARVQLQALQWRASRLNAAAYGDKQQIGIGGPDGGPVQIQATRTIDATDLSPDQRSALRAALTLALTETKNDR